MSTIDHPNKTHQTTVNNAESVRQTAVSAAGATASSIRTAEIAFLRAVIASCLANGNIESGVYRQALRDNFGLSS